MTTKQYPAGDHSGRSGGGAEEGRRACKYVPGIWFHLQIPCWSRSTELSDFRQSAWSGNERECNKHWKTRAKGNDVISNVISANQHFASKKFDADIQISQTQLQALLPFLVPPPERPGELTHRQTKQGHLKIKRSNSTAQMARILVNTRVCVCWTV